jgi:hypothetical protein
MLWATAQDQTPYLKRLQRVGLCPADESAESNSARYYAQQRKVRLCCRRRISIMSIPGCPRVGDFHDAGDDHDVLDDCDIHTVCYLAVMLVMSMIFMLS